MNRDGLKKLYLIKSAGFEYSELNLADNTLLLGESGVGKTTIMRAVLFFYTMDYSDGLLDLSADTKKSFNDWYFKAHNSHIVYEYTKDGSRFLFVVSKSGKLHYTFIDLTNREIDVKALFVDDNMPVNLEKLHEKIQKNALPNYTTTLRDKYINTFHKRDSNNKKIKQDSTVDFSLFESINSTKEFAKTLSNIFISSKVNSRSIKKSIVSLIENSEAKIDLNEIKINLAEYVAHKDEIEKFEKKIPAIKKLAQKQDDYNAKRKEFRELANELFLIEQQLSHKMQEISLQIDSLDEREQELQKKFAIESGILQEKIEEIKKATIEEETLLRELQTKAKEYKAKDIESLVEEHEREKRYKTELESHQNRYNALTSEYNALKEKYAKIIAKEQQDMNDALFALKKKKLDEKDKINSEKMELIESKEDRVAKATKADSDEKQNLENLLHKEEKDFNAINIKLGEVKFFPFNKEEIAKYEQELKIYDASLNDNKISLNNNQIKIQKVEEEIERIALKLEEENRALEKQIQEEKDTLFRTKADVEKRLDFSKANLYGYLNKNDIANREKIITYLKDDILFAERAFQIDEASESESIFGLHIRFEEEFTNEYDSATLLTQLQQIKERIKKLNRDAIRHKEQLEETASKETQNRERQRARLYNEKQKLEMQKRSYESQSVLLQSNLEHAKQVALDTKKEKTEALQKQQIAIKEKIASYRAKIETLDSNIKITRATLIKSIDDAIQKYDEQLQALKKEEINQIVLLKNESAHKIEMIEAELQDTLERQGVDEALLREIVESIKVLEKRLKAVEHNRALVLIYLNEYKDKIKTIPSLKEKLDGDREYLEKLEQRKEEVEKAKKSQLALLQQEQKDAQRIKANIEGFAKNYKEQIENQDIEKRIKESISLEYKTKNELKEIEPLVVDRIVNLYKDIKVTQESIESSVLKIIQNFKRDNIFKIEIPSDFVSNSSYLKTAKELIEYIENDKLTRFKEVSLSKFKHSITLIKKQLSLFEDALLDINDEVRKLANAIAKATSSFKVIDAIDVRFLDANSQVLTSLQELSLFYDDNNDKFLSGLFDAVGSAETSKKAREQLRTMIIELVELLNVSKEYLELENGFVVEFRAIERGNDLKWRQTLDDIGSTGTSTLVKSIINIAMLKLVSSNIVKNSQIVAHCILDEIGTISTDYFKELKDFVNESGFVFLNGMPTEDDMIIDMYPTIYIGQNFGTYSKMILASKIEA